MLIKATVLLGLTRFKTSLHPVLFDFSEDTLFTMRLFFPSKIQRSNKIRCYGYLDGKLDRNKILPSVTENMFSGKVWVTESELAISGPDDIKIKVGLAILYSLYTMQIKLI